MNTTNIIFFAVILIIILVWFYITMPIGSDSMIQATQEAIDLTNQHAIEYQIEANKSLKIQNAANQAVSITSAQAARNINDPEAQQAAIGAAVQAADLAAQQAETYATQNAINLKAQQNAAQSIIDTAKQTESTTNIAALTNVINTNLNNQFIAQQAVQKAADIQAQIAKRNADRIALKIANQNLADQKAADELAEAEAQKAADNLAAANAKAAAASLQFAQNLAAQQAAITSAAQLLAINNITINQSPEEQILANSFNVNISATQYGNFLIGIGTDGFLYAKKNIEANWNRIPPVTDDIINTINSLYILKDGTFLASGLDNKLYSKSSLLQPWVGPLINSCCVGGAVQYADGTYLGIGVDFTLYRKTNITDEWTQIPNSGLVSAIIVKLDGSILGVGQGNNKLFSRSTLTSPWLAVGSQDYVTSIAMWEDGTLLGVGVDGNLYQASNEKSNWNIKQSSIINIRGSNSPIRLKGITSYTGFADAVKQARILNIVQSKNFIIAIGSDYKLYIKQDLTNNNWIQVPDIYGDIKIVSLTILNDKTLLGVGTNNQLYSKTDLSSKWIGPILNSCCIIGITQYKNGVLLGVGTDFYLYTKPNLTSAWVKIPNSGFVIAVTTQQNGDIIGVAQYDYKLFTKRDLSGSGWNGVNSQGQITSIAEWTDGAFVGIGTDKRIYTTNGLSGAWTAMDTGGYGFKAIASFLTSS